MTGFERGLVEIDGRRFPTIAQEVPDDGYLDVVIPFESGLFAEALKDKDGDWIADLCTDGDLHAPAPAREDDRTTLCWTLLVTAHDMADILEEWSRWSVDQARKWKTLEHGDAWIAARLTR